MWKSNLIYAKFQGRSLFVNDNDDIAGKIINLLNEVLTPSLDNINLNYN